MPSQKAIDLARFLPYRLSVLSNTISQAIASDYEARFGLSITQWRVMAVLGQKENLAARDVAIRTAMDKVAVSRAVAGLIEKGHLERTISEVDKRESCLRLSDQGREIHDQIVPLAYEHERRVLQRLSSEEREWLMRILDALHPSQDSPE